MGKVQGRQLTLPASLNQRVNLHRGHNGFSLAKPPHMQAACHRPCSRSLTPFCATPSSRWLRVRPRTHLGSARRRRRRTVASLQTCGVLNKAFIHYFHILYPEAKGSFKSCDCSSSYWGWRIRKEENKPGRSGLWVLFLSVLYKLESMIHEIDKLVKYFVQIILFGLVDWFWRL